jgi:glycosyltransferase involved in cell wall biosynthesis
MTQKPPRVTLGMPVYNGEPFLEEALQSLLAQTYGDFELLIFDNASTDGTSEICRFYAAREPRIRYLQRPGNIGYARNQNAVIERAQGEYFLLTHHDDVRLPTYLERTIEVLDRDPSVVVCYTATRDIDEHGAFLPRRDPDLRIGSDDLRTRFRDIVRMDHLCEADFGLTRMSALRETRLHGDYADSDRVLLAELALRGRIARLDECLFHRRAHASQSTAIAPDRQARTVWFNPAYRGKIIFPHFRQLREYVGAVRRAPIPWDDRAWCLARMFAWTGTNRRRLIGDLDFAGRALLRPLVRRGARASV